MSSKNKTMLLVMHSFLCTTLCLIGIYISLHAKQSGESGGVQSADQEAPHVIERVVSSSSQLWRPVQERVRDTVVQIFSQIAEFDLLQPYKTPSQGAAYGSAFIIDEEGYMLSNWHVVNQAKALWAQIPSLGKRFIDVDIIGVSPERDIALLKIADHDVQMIRQELGYVPFLPLGNSDHVFRSDEVLALGYPLGEQSLKSTSGIVSGREHHFIQTSAPLNPGNSGGPLVNARGEVVGINSAGVLSAQNVGYAIPINDVKSILTDLHSIKLLHKPFLGVLFNHGSEEIAEFLGNPLPGGFYVVEVVGGSTLDRAGVRCGDMIYEINGHAVDMFGEMTVPWSEDKISIVDFVGRLLVGEAINVVFYRHGERKEVSVKFEQTSRPAICKIYPDFEEVDYEVIPGGLVVMQLTLNHIQLLAQQAPGLVKFTELKNQKEPVLVITHMFPNSQAYRTRTLTIGSTLNEVNGIPVRTLEDLRLALKKGATGKFLTIRASDHVSRASYNIFVALRWSKVLAEEMRLARDYRYPVSQTAREIFAIAKAQESIIPPSVFPATTIDVTV